MELLLVSPQKKHQNLLCSLLLWRRLASMIFILLQTFQFLSTSCFCRTANASVRVLTNSLCCCLKWDWSKRYRHRTAPSLGVWQLIPRLVTHQRSDNVPPTPQGPDTQASPQTKPPLCPVFPLAFLTLLLSQDSGSSPPPCSSLPGKASGSSQYGAPLLITAYRKMQLKRLFCSFVNISEAFLNSTFIFSESWKQSQQGKAFVLTKNNDMLVYTFNRLSSVPLTLLNCSHGSWGLLEKRSVQQKQVVCTETATNQGGACVHVPVLSEKTRRWETL